MGRDVLFERIAPATYALESFRSRYADLIGQKQGGNETSKDNEDQSALDEDVSMKDVEEENHSAEAEDIDDDDVDDDDDDDMEEDQDNLGEQNTESHEGEAWLAKLKESSYDSLTLDEKSALLGTLCQLALDSMTARLVINARQEEQMRIKRSKIEDDKLESSLLKHRKQLEQIVNARKNALKAEQELKKIDPTQESNPQPDTSGSTFEKSKAEIDLEAKVTSAEKIIMGSIGQTNGITNEMLKERARKRAEEALKELNLNSVRFEPLGCDRRYNRYYRFCSDENRAASGSTKGRIYFENSQTGQLKAIVSEQALQELMRSLNPKGPRERELKASLARIQDDVISNMPSSSWNELRDASSKVKLSCIDLCPCAHSIIGSLAGSQAKDDIVLKVREAIETICKALEETQLKSDFKKEDFVSKLSKSESMGDLKQCLGDLEASIVPEYVHSGFPLEPLLVRGAWISIGAEVATALPGSTIADVMLPMSPDPKSGAPKPETQDGRDALAKRVPLSWLPETPASMALRVLALDTALRYRSDECGRETMTEFQFSLRPYRSKGSKNGLVESMSVGDYGRVDPTQFAKFPYRLLFGPRIDFEISKEELLSDIQKESDEPLSSVLYKRQPTGTGRGRGRGRGRGSRRVSAGRGEGIKRQDTEEKLGAQDVKDEFDVAPGTANGQTPEEAQGHTARDSSNSLPSPASSSDFVA